MTAALSRDAQRRYARIELIRRCLAVAAGPLARRAPPERLPIVLWRGAGICDWVGRRLRFQPADALDPDLRGLALRELARACRACGREVSLNIEVENEAKIRQLQADGRKTLWCGLHHALAGILPTVFERWSWPAACLTAQSHNPAWGDSAGCQMILPSAAGMLELRRAIQARKATVAVLDDGRQSCRAATVSPGLLHLARRSGATPVAFRAELAATAAEIRIHTRLGPSPDLPADLYQAEARAAVEALYGPAWGVRVLWSARRQPVAEPAELAKRCAI